MQLRNGKITNGDKKDTLVGAIKCRLNLVGRVPAGKTLIRIAAAQRLFSLILDNIDYIMSDEFQPNEKFVQTVYNKTFEMVDDAYVSAENYISENKRRNGHTIRRQVVEFCSLLYKVQTIIKTNRPQIRAPYGYTIRRISPR